MWEFQELMGECFAFLSYKWNIWGFSFSFLNIMIFVEVFNIVMHTVAGVFGEEWTDAR